VESSGLVIILIPHPAEPEAKDAEPSVGEEKDV